MSETGWPNTCEMVRRDLEAKGQEADWQRIAFTLMAWRHWQAAEWALGQTPQEDR